MIYERIQLHRSCISIGTDCLRECLESGALSGYSSHFVLSQEPVWRLHGPDLIDKLAGLGIRPEIRLVPDGEPAKNLQTFSSLVTWLARAKADRKSLLTVLGGGVVGDLGGFVASAFMRGIDWFYIPTTLLAQQDASIGGKVAVNLPEGKNLVGHFWHPRAVIMDSRLLATLPQRQVHAGFMELLKHGMLHGPDFFESILKIPADTVDWSGHLDILTAGLKVKVAIVEEDPFEENKRRLLNLGHTLGHALERHAGYGSLLHGEAVGLGLIFAAMLAQTMGSRYDWSGMAASVRARLPPLNCDCWSLEQLLEATKGDKKGVAGVVSWIIPYKPGKVEIVDGISEDRLRTVLADFLAALR